MSLMRDVLLWASQNRWLKRHVPRWWFVRRATSRFMPGETLEDALRAAQSFARRGLPTTLTHLGENVATRADAQEVVDHYLSVLDRVAETGLDAEISVKLTHLGFDLDQELAFQNLATLVRRARERGNWVWVDMESSRYVEGTVAMYRRALEVAGEVGLCLQAYLHRTRADIESLLPLRPSIRMVKGAYREDPAICYQRRSDIDRNFLELSRRLLRASKEGSLRRLVVATHDVDLIGRVEGAAAELGMGRDAAEVQMLYGIRQQDQFRLLDRGTPSRCLISYGSAWYPWFLRRLAERPANLLFVLRNLFARRPAATAASG